ncbi:hypothetical protein PoB_007104600 [Plakobranchus ocellatus]|uniref:Uncharacterized protein n=1 Tax=Plakobranchus ocellatus TaxID=259542 RepID=A0AAV4DK26_9GAST|nr:hypothetical protein PoB_007104600 [Plakobranchus ocellatus]
MWFLRRMLWIPWTAKKTNERVLNEANKRRSLVRTIRKRQATFLGHVMRRGKLEHLVTTGKFEGKRSRGRQREKIMDGLCHMAWTRKSVRYTGRRYQSILKRLVSTSTLSLPVNQASGRNAEREEVEGEEREDEGNELDLGFISHAQFDTGANYDVVRYMMMSGPWIIRLSQLHTYLTGQLKAYSGSCCAPYPPSILNMPSQAGQQPTELNITIKSYASNLSLNSDLEGDSISDEQNTPPRAPLPPGSNVDTIKLVTPPSGTGPNQTPSSAAIAGDSEVSVQWYQPGLGESDPARPQAIAADRRILMLYALTRGRGNSKLLPGFIWVSQHRLNDLHDRLALLSQRAEISLIEKAKKEATPPSPTPSKAKKTQRIKALSPKVQRDEQLESLLKQCLDDAVVLTSSILEQGPASQVAEIPFEVSKANIKSLENIFDPSLGLTLKGSDLLPWILKLFP